MIRHIRQLLVAVLIAMFAIWIVISNNTAITFKLWDYQVTANSGAIVLGAFACGLILATFVASYFALMAFLREKRLLRRDRERVAFFDGFLKARSLMALEEWDRAQDQWQRLIKKDPTNIIAKVELSKALERGGFLNEALQVLDATRAASPENMEVLIRAAELHLALGNKTAALDNLALSLYQQPTKRAARMARDLSEGLDRYDDAIEYHAKLAALGAPESEIEEGNLRLQFKKLMRDTLTTAEGKKDPLIEAVKKFLKRNPEYVLAQETLKKLTTEPAELIDGTKILSLEAPAPRLSIP